MHAAFLLVVAAAAAAAAAVETSIGFDARHSVLYEHRKADSLFGYSLAVYTDQGQRYVIAGAPHERVTTWKDEEDNQLGRAYRCSYNERYDDITCGRVPMAYNSRRRDEYHRIGHTQPNRRSQQWMGATVSATTIGRSGYFTVCAPRFVVRPPKPEAGDEEKWRAAGECQLFPGFEHKYHVLTPCNDTSRAELGQCLAGFSASVAGFTNSEGKEELYFAAGLPGGFDGSGELFVANYKSRQLSNSWMLKGRVDVGQLVADKNRSHYLGYSLQLAALQQRRQPQQLSLIAATPLRGSNQWRGVVTVRDIFMTSGISIPDTVGTVGDYFGYSVAAADFNGDGIGDIAVGAPMVSNTSRDRVNAGRVYVFYGRMQAGSRYNVWPRPTILESHWPRGYFGHAVVAVGDVDDDGLQDLGVGCPYCGETRRGEVHIFLSRRNLRLRRQAQQILRAEDHRLKDGGVPKLFGWSLSGGVDFDGNGQADIVVGASGSSAMLLYKARPIIRLRINANSLHAPSMVSPKKCRREPLNCQFTIVAQLQLTSRLSTMGSDQTFTVELDLDSLVTDPAKKRVRSIINELKQFNDTVKIPFNATQNYEKTVKIDPDITDIVTPIVIRMKLHPTWSDQNLSDPILHLDSDTNVTFPPVQIEKDQCGSDNICEPDLRLSLRDHGGEADGEADGVVFYKNRDGPRKLQILLQNRGEMAFNTLLQLSLPAGIKIQYPIESSAGLARPDCSEDASIGILRLECRLGNVIGGKEKSIGVNMLLLDYLNSSSGHAFTVNASVTSQTLEPQHLQEDNAASIEFRAYLKADLLISASPDQDVVFDERSSVTAWQAGELYRLSSLGAPFRHSFEIFNSGPSPLMAVDVNISIPLLTSSGDTLVLLLDELMLVSDAAGLPKSVDASPRVLDLKTNKSLGSCQVPPEQTLVPRILHELSAARDQRRRRSTVEVVDAQAQSSDATRASVLSDVLSGQTSSQSQELLACGANSDIFGSFRCSRITCNIDELPASSGVRVIIDGLLWAETMFNRRAASVRLRSSATVGLRALPSGRAQLSNATQLLLPATASVEQHFFFRGVKPVPVYRMSIWVILLSVLLGLILLILIAFVLWRCGFFYRRRWASEKAPAHL